MSERQVYEGVKIRNDLIGAHDALKVWVWDHGPQEPVFPEAPDPPTGKAGDPKYDLAVIQYKRKLKLYEAALETYEAQEKEFQAWARINGGPVEMLMWSVDARDAFANDAKAVAEKRQAKARYSLSNRTRGAEKLHGSAMTPMGIVVPVGLIDGAKPGHGQEASLRRQAEGDAALLKAMQKDPVFGQEVRQ